jgi:voltage-gated potassium channel
MDIEQANATKPARGESSDSAYELFILALTLFSLLMVAAYFLLPLTEATKKVLLWIDLPISFTFLADCFHSLHGARNRRAYLKWGWLDFLGSVPLLLPLRIARLRRLIQAWRTLRRHPLRVVGQHLDQNRAQSAALIMLFLSFVVLTTATAAVLEFENDVPEANIQTARDALWWSIVTMSTVGYGDFYPSTIGGRLAALVLMGVGVGIYGVLASYLAHFFLPRTPHDAGFPEPAGFQDPEGIKAELEAVNARLEAIQAMLDDRAPPPGDSGTRPG